MAVTITPVGGDKHALREFLDVPYRIYRDDPNYVFPLLDEMKHFHDRKKNPFYRHAVAELWLARDEGRVVGRVVRTRSGVRPVFVSVGHRISLRTAVQWVLAAGGGYRIPEPVRRAHRAVGILRTAG